MNALRIAVLATLILPQWLITRDLFDGANVALAWNLKNPDGLYFWLSNANWLVAIWFFKLTFAIANTLDVNYLIVAKIILCSLLYSIYTESTALARRLFQIESDESKWLGVLCLASPSIYIFVNSAAIPILACIWLGLIGNRLYWHGNKWIQAMGLIFIGLSFQLNSNLVFLLAIELTLLIQLGNAWRSRITHLAALALLAIIIYFSMRFAAPPKQLFVEYNNLMRIWVAEDLTRLIKAIVMFGTWMVIPLIGACAALFFSYTTSRSIFTKNEWTPKDSPASNDKTPTRVNELIISAFLCFAAAFPYVMVGKGPPLFTYTDFGNGLTEQVLRAAHSGPLAPTWANTSGRHGLLFAIPVAYLTWFIARSIIHRFSSTPTPREAKSVFFILLPIFLTWVLPAYSNKLNMQYAELSLVRGFQSITTAPAGVIEVRYRPSSDWLIWSNAGTGILNEAWGKAHYFAIFYSADIYRDDLYWQYHTYFKGPGGMKSPVIQRSVGMDGFPGEECQTKYEAAIPDTQLMIKWLAGIAPSLITPAKIQLIQSECRMDQQLPNPTPNKKAIL